MGVIVLHPQSNLLQIESSKVSKSNAVSSSTSESFIANRKKELALVQVFRNCRHLRRYLDT